MFVSLTKKNTKIFFQMKKVVNLPVNSNIFNFSFEKLSEKFNLRKDLKENYSPALSKYKNVCFFSLHFYSKHFFFLCLFVRKSFRRYSDAYLVSSSMRQKKINWNQSIRNGVPIWIYKRAWSQVLATKLQTNGQMNANKNDIRTSNSGGNSESSVHHITDIFMVSIEPREENRRKKNQTV